VKENGANGENIAAAEERRGEDETGVTEEVCEGRK